MAGLCQVCGTEPSKYKCPLCQASSCSLACSQSHKSSCTGSTSAKDGVPQNGATNATQSPGEANALRTGSIETPLNEQATRGNGPPNFADLARSPELAALFVQYPSLRAQLHDIYKMTLEEEWEEVASRDHSRGRGRDRGGHRGRGGARNKGPWTAEKGFNRGLARVKRWREVCEEGFGGVDGEGFMKFAALVLKESEQRGISGLSQDGDDVDRHQGPDR